jgi:hypothetical protein
MKYKIKFELDYSDLSKQEMRDSKINEILTSDKVMMEMEVDPKIKLPLPKVDSIIEIDGKDYIIKSTKFRMESDCYTILHLVEDLDLIKEKKIKEWDSRMRAMKSILK